MARRPGLEITIVVTALAALLLGVAALCAAVAWPRFQELKQIEAAQTLSMAVDLSKPGETTGVLEEPFTRAHFREIRLLLTPPTDQPPAALLEGLTARVQITNAAGEVEHDQVIEGGDLASQGMAFRYPFLSVNEKYRLTLTVTDPAPALAGISQQLVGGYRLCCEGIGVVYLSLIAAGATVVGMPLGIWATVLIVRRTKG